MRPVVGDLEHLGPQVDPAGIVLGEQGPPRTRCRGRRRRACATAAASQTPGCSPPRRDPRSPDSPQRRRRRLQQPDDLDRRVDTDTGLFRPVTVGVASYVVGTWRSRRRTSGELGGGFGRRQRGRRGVRGIHEAAAAGLSPIGRPMRRVRRLPHASTSGQITRSRSRAWLSAPGSRCSAGAMSARCWHSPRGAGRRSPCSPPGRRRRPSSPRSPDARSTDIPWSDGEGSAGLGVAGDPVVVYLHPPGPCPRCGWGRRAPVEHPRYLRGVLLASVVDVVPVPESGDWCR